MSLNQLPKSLNETYANILRKVRRDDVELLRRLLLWVAFTVLPLTIEELQDAVAVEAGIGTLNAIEESRLNDPKDILSIGGSLLSVSESGHVKLAHLSVKDYLLSADIKASPDLCGYGMAPEKANQELAINCITYLSLDSLANGPVEAQEDWQGRLARHLLLKHVAKGWTYFLRAASSTPELSGLVSNFFAAKSRQTFMSWIQILNSNWIFNWDDYPRHASPLYYAASFGLGDVVECLIRDGVDLDAPGSRFGGTALHGATLREHVSIMRTLLESGAQPSRADFNRITPLHTAVRIGNAEVIRTLLEFGASKDAADSLGETPHDWAIKAGQVSSQRLLRGEEYKVSDEPPRTKRSTVYERATAFFPAMAVAQGLSISSSMVRV